MIKVGLKTKVLLIISTSLWGLGACQSLSPAFAPSPDITFLTPKAPVTTGEKQIFPVTQGPGANIHLTLQWPTVTQSIQDTQGFHTKLVCTITGDLDHFKVYLVRSSTSLGSVVPITLGTLLNVTEGPFTIGKKTLSSPSGSENFVFSNVPEGKYYVAMSAHNASDANITGVSLSSPTGLLGGVNLVAISNGGGNVGSPGRVEVGPAPTYAILNSTEPALTLNLKLSSLACL